MFKYAFKCFCSVDRTNSYLKLIKEMAYHGAKYELPRWGIQNKLKNSSKKCLRNITKKSVN